MTITVTDYLAQESQLSDRDPHTAISTSESVEALSQHIARNINAGKQAQHILSLGQSTMKEYWLLNSRELCCQITYTETTDHTKLITLITIFAVKVENYLTIEPPNGGVHRQNDLEPRC